MQRAPQQAHRISHGTMLPRVLRAMWTASTARALEQTVSRRAVQSLQELTDQMTPYHATQIHFPLLVCFFSEKALQVAYTQDQAGWLQHEGSVPVRPCSQHGVQGSLGTYKFSLQKCVKLFGRWYSGQWETGGKVLPTNCPHLGWLYARSHVISLENKA